MSKALFPKRGEIWLVNFNRKKEQEANKIRPCLIISNDVQNELDEKITVVTLTTEEVKNVLSFQVYIENTPEAGLDKPSKILLNYPYTIKKQLRLKEDCFLGVASPEIMTKAKTAWNLSFDW